MAAPAGAAAGKPAADPRVLRPPQHQPLSALTALTSAPQVPPVDRSRRCHRTPLIRLDDGHRGVPRNTTLSGSLSPRRRRAAARVEWFPTWLPRRGEHRSAAVAASSGSSALLCLPGPMPPPSSPGRSSRQHSAAPGGLHCDRPDGGLRCGGRGCLRRWASGAAAGPAQCLPSALRDCRARDGDHGRRLYERAVRAWSSDVQLIVMIGRM